MGGLYSKKQYKPSQPRQKGKASGSAAEMTADPLFLFSHQICFTKKLRAHRMAGAELLQFEKDQSGLMV